MRAWLKGLIVGIIYSLVGFILLFFCFNGCSGIIKILSDIWSYTNLGTLLNYFGASDGVVFSVGLLWGIFIFTLIGWIIGKIKSRKQGVI